MSSGEIGRKRGPLRVVRACDDAVGCRVDMRSRPS